MPKAYDTWQVFPHRPIEKLESNLWRVEGDLPNGNGTRVMTIAKLKSGGLVIHNAIALDDAEMKEIEAFGEPEVIIVPSGFHRLDSKVFKARYPKAKIVSPAGGKKKVEQVVKVDATYDDALSDDDVRIFHFDGMKNAEGVMEVKSGDRTTLVINDCVNNLPKLGGVFGFMLSPTGMPAVPRITRWLVLKDTAAFRTQLEKLAATPNLKRIIVSHGKPMEDAPDAVLKTVAARL